MAHAALRPALALRTLSNLLCPDHFPPLSQRPLEECSQLLSCSSSEETFFAFELPPYQPADVQLTPNDEPGDETTLSEECTGLLLDDGAESTQAGDGKDHNEVMTSGSGTFFGAEESDMLR